jgi:Ca2+-binding RTX toxin-like protein
MGGHRSRIEALESRIAPAAVLAVNNINGAAVVDLGSLTLSGVPGGPFNLSGVDQLLLEGIGGAASLAVLGTASSDELTYSPGGATAGNLVWEGQGLNIGFTGFDGAFSIDPLAGADEVNYLGQVGQDVLTVTYDVITTLANTGFKTAEITSANAEILKISTGSGSDSVTLSGNAGLLSTVVDGGDQNDSINASATSVFLTIRGGSGNDTLVGGSGNDTIFGDAGFDQLTGNGGGDSLYGDDDTDTFFTGVGTDFVYGGEGDDIVNVDSGNGTYTIEGFVGAQVTVSSPGGGFTVVHSSEEIAAGYSSTSANYTVRDLTGTSITQVSVGVQRNNNFALGAILNGTLTVEGTQGDDELSVVNGPIFSLFNSFVPMVQTGWGVVHFNSGAAGSSVVLQGLGGDDTLSIDPSFDPQHFGGGAPTVVRMNGGEGNDLFIGDDGDNVFDGGSGDDTFIGNGGTDAVGGGAGNSVGDSILLDGTSGDDAVTLALNASGHLVATVNGLTTGYTNFISGAFATSGIERLRVSGGDGDDLLSVDSTEGAIPVGITYEGADGSDGLLLSGGAATSSTYTPGPAPGAGRSENVIGGVAQSVSFTGLEPVIDLVASALLTVNGTHANNAINYTEGSDPTRGLVSVDGFETIEFSNKTALAINALAGSDTIHLNNPSTPAGLTGISVVGGDPTDGDELVVNGTAGADLFAIAPTGADSGTVAVGAAPLVTYAGIERIAANGLAGDDTFALGSTPGGVKLIGGAGSDTVDFSTGTEGVLFDLDLVGAAQVVNGSGLAVALGDVLENFVGTSFNDTLSVNATAFPRTLDGGPHAVFPPGDRLVFDALGAVVQVTKTDFNTGTISAIGFAPAGYDEFETVETTNSPSGSGSFGGDAFNTASIYPLRDFTLGGKPFPGIQPTSVASGDLDGDGFIDLVTSNGRSKNFSVLLNNGDGTFAKPVNIPLEKAGAQDLVLGDFNGDTFLDAVLTQRTAKRLAFVPGDGAGGFGAPVYIATPAGPHAIAAGDLNNDLNLDLAVTHIGRSSVSVLLGDGVGGFSAPVETKTAKNGFAPVDVAIADFNNDGDADVLTANFGSNTVSFDAGDGTGALQVPVPFKTGARPSAIGVADFDLDGNLDLVVSHRVSRFASVLFGNGAVAAADQFDPQLSFSLPWFQSPNSLVVADFDGDGNADLGLGNSRGSKFTVLLNTGLKTFSQPIDFDMGGDPRNSFTGGLAAADFNNDGLLDVAATGIAANTLRAVLHRA